jgi:hypothetical protein
MNREVVAEDFALWGIFSDGDPHGFGDGLATLFLNTRPA